MKSRIKNSRNQYGGRRGLGRVRTRSAFSVLVLVMACSAIFTIILAFLVIVIDARILHTRRVTKPLTVEEKYLSELFRDRGLSRFSNVSLARFLVRESKEAKFDPLFVVAVIATESSFISDAVSNKGAMGLMQIMPTTAKHVVSKQPHQFSDDIDLKDPEDNIKIGLTYLKSLLVAHDGDKTSALAAYNVGPTRVLKHVKQGKGIPKDGVKYARKVMNAHVQIKADYAEYINAMSILKG